MRSNIDSTPLVGSLKALSVAVASAVILMSGASAAGLGKLTVLSSLGQPLRAEIEMTSVAKEEVGTLAPKLASQAAFQQANIEFNPALMSLRFAVEQRGAASIIKVSSTQPMNEPFIDMLLELNGTTSRLLREYTFLLDPADLRMSQPAQVAAPTIVPAARQALSAATSNAAPVRNDSARSDSARNDRAPQALASRKAPAAASTSPAQDYQVKKGDSLAVIANQVKPAGVSLDQMLIALYRANPDAFIDKNINRLRAGQILSVPDQQTAASVAPAEAKSFVVAQTRDFNEYRSKLAAQAVAGAAKPVSGSRQSAAGSITSTVEEPSNAGAAAKDKLKLSKADLSASKGANGPGAAGAEDLIAKDKALAEANARVKDLEKNLADLQKLLEIKNKSLADQQQQANGAKAAAAPVPAPAAPSTAPVAKAEADAVPAVAAPAAPAADATADKAEPAATPAPAIAAAPAAEAAKPAVAPVKRAAPPPPPPEPSFIESLLENAMFLPGAGLLLAILGALAISNSRRKKKQQQFSDSILADSSLKANSLFGSTGGQSVDTNNSVFNSSFAPSASHLDANEVDPVAEADVYIAYGRDAQAEEILKEALRTQPDRNPVRLKLLEIYANRKDLRSFELLASDLYAMTKGHGDEWSQATALGLTLDPTNPLYAGGVLQEDVAAKAAVMMAPTEPLEELDLDALLATTQPHSIIGKPADTVERAAPPEENQFADLSGSLAVEPPSAPVATADTNELPTDLDFDLGDFAKELQPTAAAQPEAPAALDFGSIDFSLDPVSAAPSATGANVDTEAGDTAAILPAAAAAAAEPEPESVSEIDVESPIGGDEAVAPAPLASETHVDFAALDGLDVDEPAASAGNSASPAADFDLDGINFDLGDASLLAGESGDADPYSAEMSTKLDLALAYREIGDKEGARELLDEVVKSGSQQQIDKAKSLLAEMA